MRRARSHGLLLCALAAGGLSACGDGDESGDRPDASASPQALTVAVDALPETLDPARASTPAARAIAVAIQTPLLTYRRKTDTEAATLEPALAGDLPTLSADGTEYRFTLRPGLLYADGRVVTASDVERAIAHASRDATNPELRDTLAGIIGAPSTDGQTLTGVRTDDRTGAIVVRLAKADGRIPLALADPATAPMPELPRTEAGALPPSTGPLRVARVSGSEIQLVANPLRARISTVPAARATQITITDRPVTAAALTAGEVDLDLQPGDFEGPFPVGSELLDGGTGTVWSLLIAPRGLLADRGPRRALAAALDRRPLGTTGAAQAPNLAAACGLIPGYVVGAVFRDDCPPAPVASTNATLRAATVRLAVPRESEARDAVLGVVQAALLRATTGSREIESADPGALVASGGADAALVRVSPGLPHPEAWLASAQSVDQLLSREVPRLTAGPLTGSADRWSSLEQRAVDRAIDVPLAVGRRTVLAGEALSRGTVILHPVLGLDLTALSTR